MATGIINDLHVKSASINATTDSKGALLLTSDASRIVIGVSIDQNYRVSGVVKPGETNNSYIVIFSVDASHNLVAETSKAITGTYYYLTV